jgi:FKBP-type peptidyl-prolyl cis-trans isomerase
MNYGAKLALSIGIGLVSFAALAEDNQATQSNAGTQMQTTSNTQNFLNENKTKPGVVTLADGLQYKVIKEGNGEKPSANDVVVVNYAGKLVNGKEFDSSYKRGEPATFPVNAVIRGWTEALQLMKVGSTWELYIPAELAYGDRGVPGVIPPNETLIFTVELLNVKKS